MKRKNILITGGAQGIGKAIVLKCLDQSCSPIILDNNTKALEKLTVELSEDKYFRTYTCDVSNEKDVLKVRHDLTEQNIRLHGIINNAGVMLEKPMEELDFSEWKKVIDINLSGTFLISKHMHPLLENREGSIINMCSTRAFMSEPNTEAYAASKGGIYSLTHAMAMSLGPKIRVNCISPGWIDVRSFRPSVGKAVEPYDKKHHTQHPAGRIGDPYDVAEMVLYLLSEKASFITAQNFVVDGGMTRKMIYI
jgi:NAD(P)-dependent dehydrogenase (short-subunit alcohol dehydrogenase family)